MGLSTTRYSVYGYLNFSLWWHTPPALRFFRLCGIHLFATSQSIPCVSPSKKVMASSSIWCHFNELPPSCFPFFPPPPHSLLLSPIDGAPPPKVCLLSFFVIVVPLLAARGALAARRLANKRRYAVVKHGGKILFREQLCD